METPNTSRIDAPNSATMESDVPGSSGTSQDTHIESDWVGEGDENDEGYATTTTAGFVSSLASNIRRGVAENGLRYAAYGIYKLWIPIGEEEVSYASRLSPLAIRVRPLLLLAESAPSRWVVMICSTASPPC